MSKDNTKPNQKPEGIFSALLAFQMKAIVVKETATNPAFKSSYATLEDVIEAVKEASEFGLCFMQRVEMMTKADGNVLPVVRTIVIHAPSGEVDKESIVPIYLSESNRGNPMQALGSGITYAKRYGLQTAFGLPSEDDDGNAAGNTNGNKKPTVIKPTVVSNKDEAETNDKPKPATF